MGELEQNTLRNLTGFDTTTLFSKERGGDVLGHLIGLFAHNLTY